MELLLSVRHLIGSLPAASLSSGSLALTFLLPRLNGRWLSP